MRSDLKRCIKADILASFSKGQELWIFDGLSLRGIPWWIFLEETFACECHVFGELVGGVKDAAIVSQAKSAKTRIIGQIDWEPHGQLSEFEGFAEEWLFRTDQIGVKGDRLSIFGQAFEDHWGEANTQSFSCGSFTD